MNSNAWDDELSDEQKTAASQFGSHARLLAGPGTGKTHTLSRKVVYLVTQENVPPREILVLTFTRLATRQLRTTIKRDLSPYSTGIPHISTLHGFSLRQLRRNSKLIDSLPQPLRIADDWEESEIIYEDLKGLLGRKRAEIKDGFEKLSADWQRLHADSDDWRANLPDAKFVGMWEEHRGIYGYTLRAELVYQLKKAMNQVAEFALEPRFRHVLIDEYQDLNPCDQAIVRALAMSGVMVVACGDDDQSIYGFRFADPSGIRSFTNQFADAADLVLTECWRCDPEILRAAIWVAEQDARRVPKDLRAIEGKDQGEVHLLNFLNGREEAAGVAELSQQLIKEGTSPGEILVLLRSDFRGVLSRPLQNAFEQRGIPVAVKAEKRSVLDELHGRKLLSMLRLIADPFDHLAWRTRFHVWGRIGEKTIDQFYEFARTEGVRFSDAVRRLDEFEGKMNAAAPRLLQTVIARTLANREQFSSSGKEQVSDVPADLTENLKSLVQQVAETEIAVEDGRDEILAFIGEIIDSSGATNLDDLFTAMAVNREELEPELDQKRVNILTMHQAKGLSADVVFVISAEDEVLPRDAKSIDDDLRLLYVSMTRARHKLFITYSGRRDGPQLYTGRNSGKAERHLTRYLRNSPIQSKPGSAFVEARIAH